MSGCQSQILVNYRLIILLVFKLVVPFIYHTYVCLNTNFEICPGGAVGLLNLTFFSAFPS